jgi:hypothetical protein
VSKNWNGKFDMITVIIDWLTSIVYLVPRQEYKAQKVAELVFVEVYRLHGLLKTIISDHNTLFTSTLWTHLHKLIGIELKLLSTYTSACHPQTDGVTESANHTITQTLQQCVKLDKKD